VDRIAEAQFRKSYENQREELERWLTYNLDAATAAAPYDIAAALTDSGQDSLMDPKTRGILVTLRKEFIEAVPRVARPDVVSELGEAVRVIAESGAYVPSALVTMATALAERMEAWPAEAREGIEEALQAALPTRAPARGRPAATNGRPRAPSAPAPSAPSSQPARETAPAADGAPPSPERILSSLFTTGPDAGRAWAEVVAGLAAPPDPPADPEALATGMAGLSDQGREIACKRMRVTLPAWCETCAQGHLKTIGRLAPAGETLAATCQRLDSDPDFAVATRAALPELVRSGAGCTEPGLRAAGRVVERLWNEEMGDALADALAHSTHPRPGAVRRLLSEEAPSLAGHLARGGPLTDAPWRETLSRRGVPWADRLALPLGRIPAEALLPLWSQELEEDPMVARGLLDAASTDAARSPAAASLLIRLLDGRPALVPDYLPALLSALAGAPDALAERPRLARALWEAVLARPAHLAALPEALGETLGPMLPEAIPPTREWAAAFLRGPVWLRAPLSARLGAARPDTGAWLNALLAELGQGAIPEVPDAAAARVAGLLREAVGE
jgi:hypothetical protein